jgi:hypothetical protein
VDPTRTGIFGMVFGAIRMTIARLVFDTFGVPFVGLVAVIYRAIFLFVWFEILLLVLRRRQ